MKILYFYITNNFEGFQSFNVHIKEFIENANKIEGVTVSGYRPLAVSTKRQAGYMNLYGKVKKFIPRFMKDLLALWANIGEYHYAVKRVKEEKPDVILFRYNFMNIYQIFLKKKFNIPVMLEVNSPLTYERKKNNKLTFSWLSWIIEKKSWQSADKIYVVSDSLKKILAKDVSIDKIISIHNGANPSYYQGLEKTPNEKLRIGFVGSFQKYHGIDILFDTIPTILDKYANVEFCLIGKGGLYNKYKTYFDNQPEYKERVILKGFVPYENIPSEIVNFDIAMMMDFTEYGSPLKLFEYMMAKCCILLPDRETIKEIMVDGEDTLLFKPRDGRDFTRILGRVIKDSSIRKKMSDNAYKKVNDNFTWLHNANKIINELRELV